MNGSYVMVGLDQACGQEGYTSGQAGKGKAQDGGTLLEHRVSPKGQTGSTTSVRLTLADMPWLFVTLKVNVYTPATFVL